MHQRPPDLLTFRARQHPDRPAVLWRGRWIDYAELDRRARRAAASLAARGVGPGDRVALLAANHLAYLELLYAAPLLGFALCPLNDRLPPSELALLARDLEPRLLVSTPELANTAEALHPHLLETAQLGDAEPLEGAPVVALDDPALLLFTGGSTGIPKAAVISHRQLAANVHDTVLGWQLSDADSAIVATPMFHAAINVLVTPLLALGGRVMIQERFDPGQYLAWVREHQPTRLFMVPAMYARLAQHPDFVQTDFSSVREAICGGAPCPASVRQVFAARGVAFRQGYGLTEAGVNCFAFGAEEAERFPDAVGRPMPSMVARLVGADGADVADGEVGALWLSGPAVMSGYWQRPEETARALVEQGGRRWLVTGDLATRDAAGRFTVVGRAKEMFISGGENVFPARVEAALGQHPAVLECAVVGVESELWGEEGLAAVVLAEGAQVTAAVLAEFLRARLARYEIPKRFVFLPELPRSAAGKVVKPALAALAAPTPLTPAC